MSDAEYYEACEICVEWINFERASKKQDLLNFKMFDNNYSLELNGIIIVKSENVQKFFYKVLGIARYLQAHI